MKLTLIQPTIGLVLKDPKIPDGKPFVDKARMEPLQLGVIAGLTPADVEVAFYDDRLEKLPFDEPTDLVAMTVQIFTARRTYEIAAEFRERNIPVILGGIHPSVVPEEASQFADSVFIGDAENLWEEVIKDAKNKRLKKLYRSGPGPAQDGILPDRSIFKGKGYLPLSLIQYGRGCRFSCSYCITSLYFDKTCFYRQVDRVIREIESHPGKLWFFVDDNFVSEKQLAKELMKAMIPLKIKWVSQASIEMVSDPELMKLMQQSGCLGHVMGFESITETGLTSINKMHNLESGLNYDEMIRIITDHGMAIWAAFILGHDEDTPESLLDILEFSLKHKFAFAAFNVLMPYPNTELYKQLEAENRLLFEGKWWLHPDYRFNHAAFIPKHMTVDELNETSFYIRKKWNSFGSILRKASGLRTNMNVIRSILSLANYNFLYRRETLKKQGMKLGLRKNVDVKPIKL